MISCAVKVWWLIAIPNFSKSNFSKKTNHLQEGCPRTIFPSTLCFHINSPWALFTIQTHSNPHQCIVSSKKDCVIIFPTIFHHQISPSQATLTTLQSFLRPKDTKFLRAYLPDRTTGTPRNIRRSECYSCQLLAQPTRRLSRSLPSSLLSSLIFSSDPRL